MLFGFQVTAAATLAFAYLFEYGSAQELISNILSSDDNYSTFWSLLQGTELGTELSMGQYTVFAPNDAAFDALPAETINFLNDASNTAAVTKTLRYHIVPGSVSANQLSDGEVIDSEADVSLVFTVGDDIIVNDATVVQPDIAAINGIIHEVSSVLTLPIVTDFLNYGVGSNIQLSLWKNIIDMTDFVYDREGVSFTLIFPTNEAVETLESQMTFDFLAQTDAPGEGIKFHAQFLIRFLALGGARLEADFPDGFVDEDRTGFDLTFNQNPFSANGAPIIVPDIKASNGVVHIAGEVPLPAWGMKSLFETLQDISTFSTALLLIDATGITGMLADDGPYSLFLPSNSAFAELNTEDAIYLNDPENVDVLRNILLYHMVFGNYCSCTINRGENRRIAVESLQGEDIMFWDSRSTWANDANITVQDIPAANGILHQLDTVLIPNSLVDQLPSRTLSPTITPVPTVTPQPTVVEAPVRPTKNSRPTKWDEGSSSYHRVPITATMLSLLSSVCYWLL